MAVNGNRCIGAADGTSSHYEILAFLGYGASLILRDDEWVLTTDDNWWLPVHEVHIQRLRARPDLVSFGADRARLVERVA